MSRTWERPSELPRVRVSADTLRTQISAATENARCYRAELLRLIAAHLPDSCRVQFADLSMRVRDAQGCEWFVLPDSPGRGPDAEWWLRTNHSEPVRRRCAPARPGLDLEFRSRDISNALLRLVAERIAGVL